MDLIFTSYSIRRIIYLLLITTITFYTLTLFNSAQSCWLPWTVFLLSLSGFSLSFPRRVFLIFITGYAAALAAFIAGNLYPWQWGLGIYLFTLITLCAWIGQYHSRYFLPLFIISLYAVLGAVLTPSHLENSSRFNFIMAGMLMTVILQLLFWPWYSRGERKFALTQALRHLKELNKEIFSCFLQPDYSSNIYLYERRVHLQKNNFLHWLQRLRKLSVLTKNEDALLLKLDQLYDLTLDYSQLRTRITDYATFELCKKELTALLCAIETIYQAWIARAPATGMAAHLHVFAQRIKEFEENFQTVLTVAARDPLDFLLFITSMKRLQKRLGH